MGWICNKCSTFIKNLELNSGFFSALANIVWNTVEDMYVIVLLSWEIICYLFYLRLLYLFYLRLLKNQTFDKWIIGTDDMPVGINILLCNGISVWLSSLLENNNKKTTLNNEFTWKNSNPNKSLSVFYPSLQIREIHYKDYALKGQWITITWTLLLKSPLYIIIIWSWLIIIWWWLIIISHHHSVFNDVIIQPKRIFDCRRW